MISVLIPFRDAALWIEESLQSLLNQTYTDWEALLMDDHSTDHSVDIVNKFTDSRIQVIQVQGRGIVAALNEGLSRCSRPFVARMDADDRMPLQRLELQLAYLQSHPQVGLVSGRVELFSELPDSRGYLRYVEWINSLQSPDAIRLHRFVESPFAHPSVLFRKELIGQLGGYLEGPFPEDYELWLRWLEAGVEMHRIPEVVLHWRDHACRLSRTHANYDFQAFRELKAKYLSSWLVSRGIHSVWYWGDGKIARQQRRLLEAHGIACAGVVEVDVRKVKPGVIHFETLGSPGGRFLISMVGNIGARGEIVHFLESQGWQMGADYILAG